MGNILAVPAALLADLPMGKLSMDEVSLNLALDVIGQHSVFRDRTELETNPEFRQVIPYVLITGNDDLDKPFVLMQRGKGQGESRLWGKYCLGAGGHVEEGHTVFYTALREVTEELGLPLSGLVRRGIILTDTVAVDKVHVGIFYTGLTSYAQFTSPEFADQNPVWTDEEGLLAVYDKLEPWAVVVARDYLGIAP